MTSLRVLQALQLLESMTECDLATATRAELLELSNRAFELAGAADSELGMRGAPVPWRDELIPH